MNAFVKQLFAEYHNSLASLHDRGQSTLGSTGHTNYVKHCKCVANTQCFQGIKTAAVSRIASGPGANYFPAMTNFIDILLYVLLAVVFVILVLGIYSLFRGGEFGRSWSNRLMRLRVLFQFIAVLVIVAGFWLKQQFG